jgi:hypothetical protein
VHAISARGHGSQGAGSRAFDRIIAAPCDVMSDGAGSQGLSRRGELGRKKTLFSAA